MLNQVSNIIFFASKIPAIQRHSGFFLVKIHLENKKVKKLKNISTQVLTVLTNSGIL
jgi:hypothetical protein